MVVVCGVAGMWVARPLLQAGKAGVAVAVGLLLGLGTAGTHYQWTTWQWSPPAGVSSLNDLASAAAAAPADPEGWVRLGLAQLESGAPGLAVESLDRANTLLQGSNPDVALARIDALMAAGRAEPATVANEVEVLLQAHPAHPKALLYGAEMAWARGAGQLARSRWTALLERARADDSPEAARVIAVLERRLAEASAAPGVPDSGPGMPGESAEALRVAISLAPGMGAGVAPATPLFVIARVPDQPGPPLAVVRRAFADLPATVTLSDANAMLPSHVLSGVTEVEIVARVALGGNPVASSGDLYGSARLSRQGGDEVTIVIDAVYP